MSDYIKPVVFKVGNEMYGVDINLVQSIEREIQVVPVPNSMPYIKGIVNLRSEVIPVYSLKKKFGLVDNGVSENTIIIDTKNVKLALEVDEVVEILNLKILFLCRRLLLMHRHNICLVLPMLMVIL